MMTIFRSGVLGAALASAIGFPALAQTADEVAANARKAFAEEARAIAQAETKSTPRTPDGRVDLSGVWPTDFYMLGTEARREGGNIRLITAEYPKDGNRSLPADAPKYRPQFVDKVNSNDINQPAVDGTFHCQWPGTPRIGAPNQVFQTAKEVVFLYSDYSGMIWRVIPTDGRGHRDLDPTYFGDSVARWEGDTLVVDSVNFVEDTWFGSRGYLHSDKMRVTERLSRKGDVLIWEATVEDPEVLTEPYKIKAQKVRKAPEGTLLEEPPSCLENDFKNMVSTTNHGRRASE